MDHDKWRSLYRSAALETNFDILVERIKAAENAIAERQLSLDGTVSAEERQDLQDSRDSLVGLRDERMSLGIA